MKAKKIVNLRVGETDDVRWMSLASHQMKSPLGAARSMLRTLLGGYAGRLSDRQRDLLGRADARCAQAEQAIERILTVAKAQTLGLHSTEGTDIVSIAARITDGYDSETAARDIHLVNTFVDDCLMTPLTEAALIEIIDALLTNALKYTPDGGQIHFSAMRMPGKKRVCLTVEDSGIGIPLEMWKKVFEPFVRTGSAASSSIPGTGLGLALVKSVAESVGGSVRAEKSDLGGAKIILELPLMKPKSKRMSIQGEYSMSNPMKIVVVGGVAAGPKAASKIIRLMPNAHVTVIEKGRLLSYAGCGLPYYLSGVVRDQKELMSTPVGVVRDPVFFQKVKNVKVLNETEAAQIDRSRKRIQIRDLVNNNESWLNYDKLVLATGARPVVPPISGRNLRNIFTVHGVHDVEGIKTFLSESRAKDVVIVGGGLIGVEVTEALVQRGCRVTMVEMLAQILRILDWEMARLVEQHMESHGVKVMTGTKVEAFEGADAVSAVITDKGRLSADMVVLAIGVRPNVDLAKNAGLDIGTTGAIKTNDRMQTSDPDIYAAGDCVECTDLITGTPCYVPLGSTANKQGRVAAVNICGGNDRFSGVLGSTVCKVFDYCVARTGLCESTAREIGFDVVTASVPAPDKAHFMPEAKPLLLKLIADRKTHRLLGAQATGPGAGDKRIDVAAMAITSGMTLDQLANADLCYAPPFSPAMDNIITGVNVLRNKIDGYLSGISATEVHDMLKEKREFVLLDVRSPGEYEQVRLPGSTLVPLGVLRARLNELSRDRQIITFCKISLRGYEAALILKTAGFSDVRVMDGGIAMWPYEKL